jgi:hypothetical protein
VSNNELVCSFKKSARAAPQYGCLLRCCTANRKPAELGGGLSVVFAVELRDPRCLIDIANPLRTSYRFSRFA